MALFSKFTGPVASTSNAAQGGAYVATAPDGQDDTPIGYGLTAEGEAALTAEGDE